LIFNALANAWINAKSMSEDLSGSSAFKDVMEAKYQIARMS
jgi:hypothetical protein